MITVDQMRAGRALIGWTQDELAARSGVAPATIRRMENLGTARSSAGNVDAVQKALEAAGVIFIAENGEGPGVRLRKDRA
jgi:transcriptional regulator with XRE-family HTH domain